MFDKNEKTFNLTNWKISKNKFAKIFSFIVIICSLYIGFFGINNNKNEIYNLSLVRDPIIGYTGVSIDFQKSFATETPKIDFISLSNIETETTTKLTKNENYTKKTKKEEQGRQPGISVIERAIDQVGQVGGKPYWSFYGYRYRVEWCACFVDWCMRKDPIGNKIYPTKEETGNNASCEVVAKYLKNNNMWESRYYEDIVTGDIIFFDWEVNGWIDHIGLVIGKDNKYVYTVEGNSDDKVRIKKYEIASAVIAGYGIMNYNIDS